jgi:repressor LexA
MTPTQSLARKALIDLTAELGYAPTLRELGDRLNLASVNAVSQLLEQLKKQGAVTWVPGKARTLKVLR